MVWCEMECCMDAGHSFINGAQGHSGIMRHRTRQILMLLVMLLGLKVVDVRAGTTSADRVFDSVSVYAGQGANHNLRELPGKIITGRLDWDKSYFTALGFGKVRATMGQSFESFRSTPFASLPAWLRNGAGSTPWAAEQRRAWRSLHVANPRFANVVDGSEFRDWGRFVICSRYTELRRWAEGRPGEALPLVAFGLVRTGVAYARV